MKFLGVPSSGSYNGITHAHNRYGQYVRSRATPVNPRSNPQATVRARMSANSSYWRTLTANQRAGWAGLATQMSRTDALGQSYNLNGFGAFVSVNNNLLAAGDARLSDAPLLVTPSTIDTATVTLTNAAFSIAYTPTPMGTGERLFVYASPQRNAGVTFESDLRLIAVGAAAAASPLVVLTAYTARFGAPITGNRIFMAIHRYKGGFRSGPFTLSQVVA